MSITLNDLEGSSKEALCEIFERILSPDSDTQQVATEKIQTLEVTEKFGVHLTEIIVDPKAELGTRQLASVHLKRYIETHWSSSAEKFRSPETTLEAKGSIKKILPVGLQAADTEVRTAVAGAISAIARWDCPENWQPIDILVNYLCSDNEFAVQGAMQVLTVFSRDLTDAQLPGVATITLQELYRIFESKTEYSVKIRRDAVRIFTTIGALIVSKGTCENGFTEQYLEPVIPKFCAKFVESLGLQNGSTSDTGLKIDIVNAIIMLISNLPESVSSFISKILPQIWSIIQIESTKVHHENVVHGEEKDTDNTDIDSDGGSINDSEYLILAVLKLMINLMGESTAENVRTPRNGNVLDVFRNLLLESFTSKNLVHLIGLLQVTEKQIELWMNDPGQFFLEENMDVSVYNIRSEARRLITKIVNNPKEKASCILTDVILNKINEMKETLTNDNRSASQSSWKIEEAFLLAFFHVHKIVLARQYEDDNDFDIMIFCQELVLPNLNNSGCHPLLLARYLSVSGLYAERMVPRLTSRFLKAISNCLQEELPACIKICAVKAVDYWYSGSPVRDLYCNDGSELVLLSHHATLFQGVFNLGNQLLSAEILTIVLKNFYTLASLDEVFTACVVEHVCTLTSTAFLRFPNNSEVRDYCCKIFESYSNQYPEYWEQLVMELVPGLVGMMTVGSSCQPQNGIVALEMLPKLLEYSAGRVRMNSLLIKSAFPAFCQYILSSDDVDTLQAGEKVLRAYLLRADDQVMKYKDDGTKTGLQYASEVVVKFLQAQSDPTSVNYTCSTVAFFIKKAAGHGLGENTRLLLEAVHSKMVNTEEILVVRSLLRVYVEIINTEFEAVLNFLSAAPDVNGQTALAFVIFNGFCKQYESLDSVERKRVDLAFRKILNYAKTHPDSQLHRITVQGNEGSVQTTVPLLSKISEFIN